MKIPWGGVAVTLGLWFGGMALAALAFDPPAVIVFAPGSSLMQTVPQVDGKSFRRARGSSHCAPEKQVMWAEDLCERSLVCLADFVEWLRAIIALVILGDAL